MELEPFIFRHTGAVIGWRAVMEEEEINHRDTESQSKYGEEGEGKALEEAVNRFTLRPLKTDEFAVFRLDLCNNGIDKHHSRFPVEELERINEMVVGRPLMERHDLHGTLPRGRFFRSILHREGESVSVRPDVYVLRTAENDSFIRNIEGGVYRETSIGFSFRTPECSVCAKDLRTCDHIPGQSYGDQVCHFIMRDVLDVIEGSLVAAGSQGTGFVKRENVLPLADALCAARDATKTKNILHKPVPVKTVEAAKAISQSDAVAEDAPQLLRDGVTARTRACERFCALGRELDGAAFGETVWRKTLSGLSLDEIHEHLRSYEARFDLKYPPQPVSVAEALPEEGKSDRNIQVLQIARG